METRPPVLQPSPPSGVGAIFRKNLNRLTERRPFADAWMDLSNVTRTQRWLAMAGYVTIGLIIALMLGIEQISRFLGPEARSLDSLTTIAQNSSYVVGWAFLLAGAAQARWRILLPALALFGLTTIGSSLGLFGFLPCLTILGVLALSVASSRTRLFQGKQEWVTVLSFLIPFVAVALFTLGGSTLGSSLGQALTGLWMYPILLIIWALSGLTVVDTAADVAKGINQRLARTLAATPLYAAIIFVIFLRLTLAIWGLFVVSLFLFGQPETVGELNYLQLALVSVVLVELLVGVPILIWLGLLAVTRRWKTHSIFLAFAISLILPIVILGFILSLGGADISDIVGTSVEQAGLMPPVLVFVFFLTISLLALGSSFAAGDSPVLPRSARIYLSLGLVLLILNFVFNSVTLNIEAGEEIALQSLQDAIFPLSLLILGVPYFLLMLFRQQEKLVGDAPAHVRPVSRWPVLDRFPPRRLIGGAIAVGILMTCSSFLVVELLSFLLGIE